MRFLWTVVLAFSALSFTSCAYLGDRSLDLLDTFKVAGGVETGLGVRAAYLGIWETGLNTGIKPHLGALGWRYGRGFYFDMNDVRFDSTQTVIIETRAMINADYAHGTYKEARRSFALFPALLTWVDQARGDEVHWEPPEEGVDFETSRYLWDPQKLGDHGYTMVHAFDIEGEIGLILYLESGWSPGETVDFLLGLLTIDIAGDDGRL